MLSEAVNRLSMSDGRQDTGEGTLNGRHAHFRIAPDHQKKCPGSSNLETRAHGACHSGCVESRVFDLVAPNVATYFWIPATSCCES